MLSMKKSGYTLVEILLVLALIGALSAFSLPVYQSFHLRNGLEVGINDTVNSLRRAQLLSQAVALDSQWGVKIQESGITIFQGSNFDLRDPSQDEFLPFAVTLVSSGITEIVFEKVSGAPDVSGNLNLTSSNNETRTITINSKGILDY